MKEQHITALKWIVGGLYTLNAFRLLNVGSEGRSTRKTNTAQGGRQLATAKAKRSEGSFLKDIKYLFKVVFQKWNSSESMLIIAFAGTLMLRTWLSILVADIDGYMVKNLITRKKENIAFAVSLWILMGIPSSFVNAMIKYLQARLALALRSRLTEHVRELYFTNENYFRISHLDKSIANPEHALTEDVEQWANRLSALVSDLGKPIVDMFFYSWILTRRLGFPSQFAASVAVWETNKILKRIRPNLGRMVVERGSLEADLRLQHNRVITASEEIAFCRGEQREKKILEEKFAGISKFQKSWLKKMVVYNTAEDWTTKYLWTVVGFAQVAHALLSAEKINAGEGAKVLITLRRMMTRTADATERVMVGVKEVAEFSGFTARVMDMVRVFKEQAQMKNQVDGTITPSDRLVVDKMPIVTPINETLIPEISFDLQPGDRLLILGPNGCGKSSLFRILCGLWPQYGGNIEKPASRSNLYFIPQKPYMVQGKFRDQIIYPQTEAEMKALGRTDEELSAIIDKVLLTQVLSNLENGFDTEKEWGEVLSGGEKQRLGLARVFYHRPRYAILDEVSSTINVEAEQAIFDELLKVTPRDDEERPMSFITISHRHTLFKYHNKLLTFDGEGHWEFNPHLHQSDLQSKSDQKLSIMRQLAAVCKTLGEDWPKSAEISEGTSQ